MEPRHLTINRDLWDKDAPNWVAVGERLWALPKPEWGNWGVSDLDPDLLPDDMSGMNAIELGCGTGYVSGWMARRGARVTGVDLSGAQLATARRLAQAHGAAITFVQANAESTGLPDESADFAISEYGAAIWCPPDLWLPEAWRLLRPGGRAVFLGNHPLVLLASPLDGAPCDRVLHRPYRGMWGADWTTVPFDPSGICFNLTMADWFAAFARTGFRVTHYHELYAPEWVTDTRASVPADWARDYPVEQVWFLEKPA
ncbi:MAG: class I SAM-dependent methyltransferase [Paracoccaceae bacterium]